MISNSENKSIHQIFLITRRNAGQKFTEIVAAIFTNETMQNANGARLFTCLQMATAKLRRLRKMPGFKNIVSQLIENLDETDSSSGSDEEWDLALLNIYTEKNKLPAVHDTENIVDRYTDLEFKNQFKLSRSTFNYLHELLQKDLIRVVPGRPTIPSRLQVMIALWKMNTPDAYSSICDRFKVEKGAAIRAVRKVCHGLFLLSAQFILWPTEDEANDVMQNFELMSGFPKVLGAISLAHIRMKAPKLHAYDYRNNQGFHSMQLQVVCDHKTMITHCYAGHPGSVDEQTVFRLSEVSGYLGDENFFPKNSHLVGDNSFEIHQNLMTPFPDNGYLTNKQKKYNDYLSVARSTVDKCIALLKGRMRSLQCLPMQKVDLMAEYVVACCVIHNICIIQEDLINVITPSNKGSIKRGETLPEVKINSGIIKRDGIMNAL